MCYDTGSPMMRGAWTGGFLKFSPSRFGLGGPPAAAGEWAFSVPSGAGWLGATARHEALHVHGKRVVIDTRRLEGDLSARLGAPVSIDHGAKGAGRVVIRYSSLDELDGILRHLR